MIWHHPNLPCQLRLASSELEPKESFRNIRKWFGITRICLVSYVWHHLNWNLKNLSEIRKWFGITRICLVSYVWHHLNQKHLGNALYATFLENSALLFIFAFIAGFSNVKIFPGATAPWTPAIKLPSAASPPLWAILTSDAGSDVRKNLPPPQIKVGGIKVGQRSGRKKTTIGWTGWKMFRIV